ncbi:uncharacterized protein LOC129601819 [Paramacrobiotus metropolitanus]|uniref:uncharacterized protein LOC129601819 n=1 Tax=Paramacrobiotus metropolitanus TaxID=2943436 RepID=UPI002445E0D0|nr:uncharacterized protein LOC129601819 [Paramacrobiotus metropolitanus]
MEKVSSIWSPLQVNTSVAKLRIHISSSRLLETFWLVAFNMGTHTLAATTFLLVIVLEYSHALSSQPSKKCVEFVMRNTGECTCKEARDRGVDQLGEKWVPSCDDNGKWSAKQSDRDGSWCVDQKGNQHGDKAKMWFGMDINCD